MPGSVLKYSGLSAKTKAMYAKLLKSADYNNLLEKKNVSQIVEYLKTHSTYSEDLKKLKTNSFHRSEIETIVKKNLLHDYEKYIGYIQGDIKAFIKVLYHKYEVEALKMIFRILESKNEVVLFKDSLIFLKKYNSINISAIAESKNTQEFITHLKGTQYYDVLKDHLGDSEYTNLFSIEASLDQYYFQLVHKKIDTILKGDDKKAVEDLFHTQTDIMNIMLIYRCKKSYKVDREFILNNLIQIQSKKAEELFVELVDTKSVKEFLDMIRKTKYQDIFKGDNFNTYELNSQRKMFRLHSSFLRKYTFSFGGIIAYIHLKEFEIQNIISLIECIRYNISLEETKKYLIIT